MNTFELLCAWAKIAVSATNTNQKCHFDNQSSKTINIERCRNIKNPDMNNIMSQDFAMRDWIDDTDQMLSRNCLEFPRLSDGYTSFKRN